MAGPSTRKALTPITGLLLLLGSAACSVYPTAPDPAAEAHLLLQASVAGTSVDVLVVQVSAPDMEVMVVANLPVMDGKAAGVVTMPAGSDRQLTVRAYNATGVETHRGSVVLQVHPGENETVIVTLHPLEGGLPIVVTLAEHAVTITPGELVLSTGAEAVLKADVTDAEGLPLEAAVVQWASLDPGVAVVDPVTALVTARAPGETSIVAVWGGVAAVAELVVVD